MSSPSQLQDILEKCVEKTVLRMRKEALEHLLEKCDEKIKKILVKDVSQSESKIRTVTHTLLQTEKMIFLSQLNTNSKREIFDLLMTRYDELLDEIISLLNDEVTDGRVKEGYYIKFRDQALERRTAIKMVCDGFISK